jgi:hypothetical protein
MSTNGLVIDVAPKKTCDQQASTSHALFPGISQAPRVRSPKAMVNRQLRCPLVHLRLYALQTLQRAIERPCP